LSDRAIFLVGTVADPTKPYVFKVAVGRATVPARTRLISGCGLARDHTPVLGSNRLWLRTEACNWIKGLKK